jgi:hypothetical protein
VRSTEVVSGPAMLRQAAVSPLKQWRYVPFDSGEETIAVTGDVLIKFTLDGKPEVHTPHRMFTPLRPMQTFGIFRQRCVTPTRR